jgi:alpha-tubulin suppressor-like RCC1 family protein
VSFAACSDHINVLGPIPLARRDAGQSPDPDTDPRTGGKPPRDMGGVTNTATDSADAGGEQSCKLQCLPGELCTHERCVPAQGVMSVNATFRHSCSVEAGRLFCWGANESGQLGQGDRTDRNRRTRVGSANDWLSVATGEQFSCGIRTPGQLYCWGDNDFGQLGLGDTASRLTPAPIAGADHVEHISCGGDSCCALDDAGELWCWGDNLEGKPGQNDAFSAPDVLAPARVGSDHYRIVAVGQGHVCAVRDDAKALCWGRNTNLQLGIGSDMPGQLRTPTPNTAPDDLIALSASQHHTCGVRADGTLWCWGSNGESELAVASADLAASGTAIQVGNDSDWVDVSVGWFHTCARKQNRTLYCWGRAIEGQLGQESVDPIPTPTKVAPPALWQRISTGNFFTCAVDDTNALYCMGENARGELGLGDLDRRHVMTALP